jgi:hypothetical protein
MEVEGFSSASYDDVEWTIRGRQHSLCARGESLGASSNKSFDRSGISMSLIENLDAIRRFFPPGQFQR